MTMTYGDPRFDDMPETQRVSVDRVEPVHEHVVEQPVVQQPVVREVADPVVPAMSPVDTIRRLVWLVFGVLQALIVLRFVLLLLGANEGNDVVAFVIGVTDPFVEPFRGMFSLDSVSGASGSVLDVAALVALVAWTLVEALILGIVGLADRRATTA
jgi:uncharacterized protein YggT (Ycf19 family)